MQETSGNDAEAASLVPNVTPAAARASLRCAFVRGHVFLVAASVLGLLFLLSVACVQKQWPVAEPLHTQGAGGLMALDEESDRQVSLGFCGVDVQQAAFYLMQAGTYAKFASMDCPGRSTDDERVTCAADMQMILNSFGWAASYISSTINSCGVQSDVQASCAASLTALVAELVEFAYVATTVVAACQIEDGTTPIREPLPWELESSRKEAKAAMLAKRAEAEKGPRPLTRRETLELFKHHLRGLQQQSQRWLQENETSDAESAAAARRPTQVAQCVVDVNLGLSFLARAGLQMYSLAGECPERTLDGQKSCTLDIFNVLSSLGWAAQFLSMIAFDCPAVSRLKAGCAAVVADFFAVLTALGPVVNGVSEDCPDAALNFAPGHKPVGSAHLFS